MKIHCFIILFFICFLPAKAQYPPIETIDFYGLRTVSEKQIREKLLIKEGDEFPKSKHERSATEDRILALQNVAEVKLSAVCCTGSGKTMLFIGVREKNVPKITYRTAPNGKIRLTGEIVKLGKAFEEAHKKAVLAADVAEDRNAGHSLMKNAAARAVQLKYIETAERNPDLLRSVLRASSDAAHRALAAEILAYYKDKREIVPDLAFAVKDENPEVRNNAMRALGLIAGYAEKHPENKIEVPFELFVEMLDSLEWTDRNKASLALNELTAGRSEKLLELLRKKAIPPLVEMARWKNEGHSAMAFFILGRVVGFSDDEIGQYWSGGRREELIQKFVKNK